MSELLDKKQQLEAVSFTLRRTDELSKSQQLVIETMLDVVDEVGKVRNEIMVLSEELKQDLSEFKAIITLAPSEEDELVNIIDDLGHSLTREYFPKFVSKKLYGMKKIHLQRGVWKILKQRFGYRGSYRTLKHEQFDEVKEFLATVTLGDIPTYYLELTEKQFEAAQENGDDISGLDIRGA